MQIFEKALSEIKPYENNPRNNDNAVSAVVASICEFGFKVPIVIDSDGVIVCGHTRYKAAQEIGLKTVPCVIADDLTPEQVKAFRLADNKVGELATWDFEKLELETAELETVELEKFGFENSGSDERIADVPKVAEDNYDKEPPKEPKANKGDIYQLGQHRLMCGDTFSSDDRQKLMNGVMADVIFYDPPFEKEDFYEKISEPLKGQKAMILTDYKHFAPAVIQPSKKGWFAWYEMIWDNVQSWFTQNRPLAQHKTCYIFGDTEQKEWNFEKAIVFDNKQRNKSHSMNAAGRGEYSYEPLPGAKHLTTVYKESSCQMHDEHGQGKPVIWVATMLEGLNAEKVFDAFGGSGTALIACEQIGIPCYSMEIEPRYVDEAIDRWESFTGQKAKKIAD